MYNLNGSHMASDVETIYESLDDAGVRTAGTTYLVYRGRHEHPISRETALTRLAGTLFRKPVMGPRELFYADIFASRETGCRSQMGLPGIRDQHSGCVGAWLAARDLYDFLLLSLPDNDTYSHKNGPHAQPASIAAADAQIVRVAEAAGGLERFLDTHAVIICADHSHAPVERKVDFRAAFGDWAVAGPGGAAVEEAELALCPNQRAAMVYGLVEEARATVIPRVVETAGSDPGRRRDRLAGGRPGRCAWRWPRGSCGSARAASCATPAATSGASEGDLSALAASVSGRPLRQSRLSRRAAPRLGGADLRDVGRRAAQRRARLGVPGLGWRRSRRRRQPRLAAPLRLAGRVGVLRCRCARGNRFPHERRLVDHRRRSDGPRALRRGLTRRGPTEPALRRAG